MSAITLSTLQAIIEQFPSVAWQQVDLEELVTPQLGVITGFQQFMAELQQLVDIDIKETPPSGSYR